MSKAVAIIPTRLDSERLPNKPLLQAGPLTVLGWVINQVKQCPNIDHIIVTGPDKPVAQHCDALGVPFIPTSTDCVNGTQRCADVLARMKEESRKEIDVVVNVQCDEPMIDPMDIYNLVIRTRETKMIHTLYAELPEEDKSNENAVKVIVSNVGAFRCHWFTRTWPGPLSFYHAGVYSFSPDLLLGLADLIPTIHSKTQRLEQLTWIEHGARVYGIECSDGAPLSINTEEDLTKFKSLIKEEGINVN